MPREENFGGMGNFKAGGGTGDNDNDVEAAAIKRAEELAKGAIGPKPTHSYFEKK